jgi:hypothetical protein
VTAAIEIEDHNAAILARFVGMKVASITREPDTGESFQHGENSVTIIFEDSSELHFLAFGYDASSLGTYFKEPSA